MRKILVSAFLALSILVPQYTALSNSPSVVARAEKVAFNVETLKVHKLSCRWAKKCTENCVIIEKKEAYKKGGIPCKVCGG